MTNPWDKISKLSFVIHKDLAIRNIEMMAHKFQQQNIVFRPHFKTHQSQEIGSWFRKVGVTKISVSSVDMARYFFDGGWRDISIVFPFNRRELKSLNEFSNKAKINILVEDLSTVKYVSQHTAAELNVFIKVDCGYHRSGIPATDIDSIKELAHKIQQSTNLKFSGLLSHFGNTYSAQGKKQVQEIFSSSLNLLQKLKQELSSDFPELLISIGDTPSASLIDYFEGVDEMRPGNFVFYDWMQYKIGSCTTDRISAIMLCPVVAKHPKRKELIIHGGAVHFSKEKLEHFGQVCNIANGFSTEIVEGNYLKSLSQEHGIVHCTDDSFSQINVGDLIGVIPIHSCLTANLMKENSLYY